MNLSKQQMLILNKIWNVLENKLVEFIGKTRCRSETVTLIELGTIGNDTLKLFLDLTEEDATIALEFVTFVIDTIIETTSLSKTISKIDNIYQFSLLY